MAKHGKNNSTKKDTSVNNPTQENPGTTAANGDGVQDPTQANGSPGTTTESSEGAQQGEQGGDNTSGENGTESTQEPTSEPTPEPTPAPAAAPTAAPKATDILREKTEFEQYKDKIRALNSVTLTTVLDILENYQEVMGLNTVTTESTINQQQGSLWRAVKLVLGSAQDFTTGFQLLINFAREYGEEGAFQHHLLFRGFEHTKLNADASRAFQNILTVITAAAESKNPATVRKNIDLARAMNSTTFSEEARSRVIGYFN